MKTILFSFSNERNFQETKINASEIFATKNRIIIKQIEILSFVDVKKPSGDCSGFEFYPP